MKINAHLKEQVFLIECNKGNQSIKWLGDVAKFYFEEQYYVLNSNVKCIQNEKGINFNQQLIIKNTLIDDLHIWIIMEDEY